MALARGYPPAIPSPTFPGLRAAQFELEIRPTPNPFGPSEIVKRLSGDPAICGWVEGDGSEF